MDINWQDFILIVPDCMYENKPNRKLLIQTLLDSATSGQKLYWDPLDKQPKYNQTVYQTIAVK